jgi:chromosome segregation ATPase
MTEAPVVAAPGPAPAPGPRRGSRWLAVLLVVTIAVGAYLWVTTVRWQSTSAEWEEKAHEYAKEVATLRMQLDGANTELQAARDQLSTATARITDLANEKAQLGDENVASQQYLDYQTQVSAAAATVASALGQCVSGQEQLVGYLKDANQYEASDLNRYERQVGALCEDAEQANQALQRELRP